MGTMKRKITAATLMETLIATVIILAVFVTASLCLNHTFRLTVRANTFEIETKLAQLTYRSRHKQLPLPYFETLDNVDYHVFREVIKDTPYVVFQAEKQGNSKLITQYQIDE